MNQPTTEYLILVDDLDQPIGRIEKLAAHRKGLLHRAFSVLVFNGSGDLLLQQRATTKYHSGGLWSNTCCGHPRPDEATLEAARRRLFEEMGFDCELEHVGTFTYHAQLDSGLTEHEVDHVFVGTFDGDVRPNPEEVVDWSWTRLEEVDRRMQHDGHFTYWFRKIWELYSARLEMAYSGGLGDAK